MSGFRGLWPDALLAVVIAGVAVGDAVRVGAGWVDHLLLMGTLVLVARGKAPLLVLGVCVGIFLVYGMRVEAGLFVAAPVLVALYTVVAAGHRLIGIGVAAPLVAGAVGTALREGAVTQQALLPVGWVVAAILLGEVVRHRDASVVAAELRAAEAERTREEVAARRAVEERLRIARELHDSLTHSISAIKVRVGVAVHLARKRGEEVPDVLLAIEDASREAARELRQTLGVLRVDTDGLDRLPALLDRARGAGLDVTVTTGGRRRPLPLDVDLAAYRIVQEALTNVTRHAGATTAKVTIDYGASELTVRVDDEGTAVRDEHPGPGLGIIGMRERVTALGGTLLAERRHPNGFTVRADLPLRTDTA